jgi:hypothetical protein
MSDSSSEDDIPLNQLVKKAAKKTPAKTKASATKKKPSSSAAKKKKKRSAPIDDSSSDDEDNMSLADLQAQINKKKKAAPKKKAASKQKASAASKKKKKASAKASKKRARETGSKSKSGSTKAKKRKTSSTSSKSKLQGAGDTEKEFKTSIDDFKSGPAKSRKVVTSADVKLQLSLAVLCRWWYVMEWPETTSDSNPGSDYVEMAGMPGVYIGTNNNVVGQMIDTRDHASPNKPSLCNMMSKDCSELIQLWISALEKQVVDMNERNDAYQCGSIQKKDFVALLNAELKHAKGLDASKLQKVADKQAKKKAKNKK